MVEIQLFGWKASQTNAKNSDKIRKWRWVGQSPCKTKATSLYHVPVIPPRRYSPSFCHLLISGTYLSSPVNPTMTFPFRDPSWQKSVAKSSAFPGVADEELGSPIRINISRSFAVRTREALNNAGKTWCAPFRLLSWIAPQKLLGIRTKIRPEWG